MMLEAIDFIAFCRPLHKEDGILLYRRKALIYLLLVISDYFS